MEAVINAEGLSREGLGSERSGVSWDSRPRSARRIKKKNNAAVPTIKSTSVTAAAVQPKRSDGDCTFASHTVISSMVAGSNMRERPVPIESGRAEDHYQHRPGSEKSS